MASTATKCALCGRTAPKACSACKVTRYCGRVCQQAHWQAHKATCAALAKSDAVWKETVAEFTLLVVARKGAEGDDIQRAAYEGVVTESRESRPNAAGIVPHIFRSDTVTGALAAAADAGRIVGTSPPAGVWLAIDPGLPWFLSELETAGKRWPGGVTPELRAGLLKKRVRPMLLCELVAAPTGARVTMHGGGGQEVEYE